MSLPIITIIGSLNTDLITRTLRVPSPGETLTSQSFDTGSGGKGANQAVACARLSRGKNESTKREPEVIVRMVGAVGGDSFGKDLISGLRRDGIDTSSVQVKDGEKTGVAMIIVEEESGENRILMSPNANYSLRAEEFTSLAAPLPEPVLIVLQLEIPLDCVLQILKTAKKNGTEVLLNPAPAMKLPEHAYKSVTHLILNESEAALLSGNSEAHLQDHTSLPGIAEQFLSLGVKHVVLTRGAKGVFFSSTDGMDGFIPAAEANVVDTTAAGDTFVGAYAVEVAKHAKGGNFDLQEAVEWANKAAAKTVERKGAQNAIPWLDEVPR
ncbi:MAG: hypothetical protein M1827_000365 [Pycnora praestabilis]|nr:MAG: hypothetical protein M1827_000365 [Pycnora praestabilis]